MSEDVIEWRVVFFSGFVSVVFELKERVGSKITSREVNDGWRTSTRGTGALELSGIVSAMMMSLPRSYAIDIIKYTKRVLVLSMLGETAVHPRAPWGHAHAIALCAMVLLLRRCGHLSLLHAVLATVPTCVAFHINRNGLL